MSAKTCENCGCFGGCSHSADDPDVCSGWKSIIPAGAQSFVICNGRVKVWVVVEECDHDVGCAECAFEMFAFDCEPCSTCRKESCGMMEQHYRIVAVEMVEGE